MAAPAKAAAGFHAEQVAQRNLTIALLDPSLVDEATPAKIPRVKDDCWSATQHICLAEAITACLTQSSESNRAF